MGGASRTDSQVSMSSSGSVVEVSLKPGNMAADKSCKLLYSKSKVYVHPSSQARDNRAGFVCIVERAPSTLLLCWIPEAILQAEERDKYVQIEHQAGQLSTTDVPLEDLFVDAPAREGPSHAFAVPISSIYSLLVEKPTLFSWYGSITVALFGGTTLLPLYFHDDESVSTQFSRDSRSSAQSRLSAAHGRLPASWGGEDLLSKLRLHANLVRSTLEPSLFLCNPSRADLEVHSTPLFDDLEDSPVPKSLQKQKRSSILHESLPSTSRASRTLTRDQENASMDQLTFSVLNAFSKITRSARSAAQNIAKPLLSHDLAKPILPHLPAPIASLAEARNPEFARFEQLAGTTDFNSAHVYLAKWARIVAEEGERVRREEVGASKDGEEQSALGAFEVLAATYSLTRPRTTRAVGQPIVKTEWDAWFSASDGKLLLTEEEAKRRAFQRGFTMDTRQAAWPFLLGVYPWSSSSQDREAIRVSKGKEYERLRATWWGKEEVTSTEAFVEECHRIGREAFYSLPRDRNQPLFSAPPDEEDISGLTSDVNALPRADYAGGQPASNVHVRRLQEILLTYNAYETDLGYVQGMSDLCSPLYICMDADAPLTFWCFVALMDRMKQNFLRDQSGMKSQLTQLQKLIAVMDPALYAFLERTESMNLFFCFRWILICFKREFPLEDVLKIWENMLSNVCGESFHLFIALAILQAHRDVLMRYLQGFDEVLKYVNELSMTMEAEPMLCQAEILHSTLRSIVAHEERVAAEKADLASASNGASASGLRSRTHNWIDEQDLHTNNRLADLQAVKDLL